MITTQKTAIPTETATIESKITLNHNVVELRLAKPSGFTFAAGQFIQLIVTESEPRIRRSYSISSTPESPYIELCIKLLPDGIGSAYVAARRVGDTLSFLGPQGKFVVNDHTAPITCVATGVGLAPIIGIIEDELVHQRNTSDINLIFGVRSEQDIFWMERLETLARDYANFHYTLTLSQPSTSWQSHTGRVTSHLPNSLPTPHHVFLCGSLDMVKDVRQHFTALGLPPTMIHFEIF